MNLLNAFKMLRDEVGHKIVRYHQVSTDEVYGKSVVDQIQHLMKDLN